MTFSQCCVDILFFTVVEFIYSGMIREREEKDTKRNRVRQSERAIKIRILGSSIGGWWEKIHEWNSRDGLGRIGPPFSRRADCLEIPRMGGGGGLKA
jgi:hypothetical protein